MLDLLGSLRDWAVCLRLACLNDDAVEQPQVLDELVDGAVRPAVEQARGASGAVLCKRGGGVPRTSPTTHSPFHTGERDFFTLGFSGFLTEGNFVTLDDGQT